MDLVKMERGAPIDIWDAFEGLRGEMDRALDALKVPDSAGILDLSVAPAVDVIETEEEFMVVADVPGLRKEDLEVTITGTLLSIKGEKREEKDSEKRRYLREENRPGSFRRTIDLPPRIDPERIAAELRDGILALRIAKREEAKTKTITVSPK